jgi:putative transposase
MARHPRLYAKGYAQLVSVHFSEAVQHVADPFLDHRCKYLSSWLGESSLTYKAAIHGWAITPRMINFLATPTDNKSLPAVVQALGRKLAAQLKLGHVFSGRYHATIPQPGSWILPALRWLEHQPVRERLVDEAELWPWSSASTHAGTLGQAPAWLQPHTDYWLCGNTPFDRQAHYRRALSEGLPAATEQHIAFCLNGQWALGDASFIQELQQSTTRRVSPGIPGRPKKQRSDPI